MTDEPTPRLTGDEILALKFAAHRQLARWSKRPKLSPRQCARRSVLTTAVRTLQDPAFADGIELRVPDPDQNADG